MIYARQATGTSVIGKEYFVRQAAILLNFAKATTDSNVSAALIDKAADLKSQVDETGERERTPLAPDVERDLTPLAPDDEPPTA